MDPLTPFGAHDNTTRLVSTVGHGQVNTVVASNLLKREFLPDFHGIFGSRARISTRPNKPP